MFKLNESLFEAEDEEEILDDIFVHPGAAFIDDTGKKWVFDEEFADAYDYYIWSAIDEEGNIKYFIVDQNFDVDLPEDQFYKVIFGPVKTYEEAQEKFGNIIDEIEDFEDEIEDVDSVIDNLRDGKYDESLNEDKKVLFIIKDRQGNQVSSPNPDDQELWDRVDDMDPYGVRGLHVVAYVDKEATETSWTDVYKEFDKIVRKNFQRHTPEKIDQEIEAFYNQHKGEKAYDKAWEKWNEPVDDDYDVDAKEELLQETSQLKQFQVQYSVNGKNTADVVTAESDNDAAKLIKDKYKGSIVTVTGSQELKEDLDSSANKEDGPIPGPDTGVSGLLIKAINDEWNTIDYYNTIIATVAQELSGDTQESIVAIVKDIINEENNHVGMLQKALELISPNVAIVKEGEVEAEEKIAAVENKEDLNESTSSKKYTGKHWEDLIKSLENDGWEVESADKYSTKIKRKWITLYKDNKKYSAEVTPYFDGDYEVMEYNIKEVE